MTDELAQTTVEVTKEENAFEHSGQLAENGCLNGKHNLDQSSANVVPKQDGSTGLIMRCYTCNQYVEYDAPLNVNDLIESSNTDIKASETHNPVQHQTQFAPPQQSQTVSDDQILSRLFKRN